MKTLQNFTKSLIVVIFFLFISDKISSQVQVGIKKINLFGDISYSSPEKEMKNYYSLGDLMKFYAGAEVPFLAVGYSKKGTTCFNVSGLLDFENANFTRDDYSTDGLNTRMASLGVRIRPFANMAIYAPQGDVVDGYYVKETTHKVIGTDEFGNSKYSEYTTTESLPIWSEGGAKLILTMFLSGLYFDYGASNLTLMEPPSKNVNRIGTFYSFGCSPSLAAGKKITMYMDIGIRKYRWINSLKTTSGIGTWHLGFGVGFNLK